MQIHDFQFWLDLGVPTIFLIVSYITYMAYGKWCLIILGKLFGNPQRHLEKMVYHFVAKINLF